MARDRIEEPVVEQIAAPPAKYEVLVSFTEPEDKNTPYWAGKDLYPRDGYRPTEERIAYLQSNNTAFKKPVIAKK